MNAVSSQLQDLISELQSLSSLDDFALAGGTSLALCYNHRISIDVDLFSNNIFGSSGFQSIQNELKFFYGDDLIFCDIVNIDIGEQYCFLKALIRKNEQITKLEVIQNIQSLTASEAYNIVRQQMLYISTAAAVDGK